MDSILLLKKVPKIIYSWIYILFISIVIIIIGSTNIKFSILKSYKGIIKNKRIEVYCNIDDTNNFIKGIILIDNQKLKINNIIIDEDIILDNDYNSMKKITIDAKISKKLLVENNVVEIKVKLPKTTLANELKQRWKKELDV